MSQGLPLAGVLVWQNWQVKGLVRMLGLLVTSSGWLRHLTRECVEANPGPVYCVEKKCEYNTPYETLTKESDLHSHKSDPCPPCTHAIRYHKEESPTASRALSDTSSQLYQFCNSDLCLMPHTHGDFFCVPVQNCRPSW